MAERFVPKPIDIFTSLRTAFHVNTPDQELGCQIADLLETTGSSREELLLQHSLREVTKEIKDNGKSQGRARYMLNKGDKTFIYTTYGENLEHGQLGLYENRKGNWVRHINLLFDNINCTLSNFSMIIRDRGIVVSNRIEEKVSENEFDLVWTFAKHFLSPNK